MALGCTHVGPAAWPEHNRAQHFGLCLCHTDWAILICIRSCYASVPRLGYHNFAVGPYSWACKLVALGRFVPMCLVLAEVCGFQWFCIANGDSGTTQGLPCRVLCHVRSCCALGQPNLVLSYFHNQITSKLLNANTTSQAPNLSVICIFSLIVLRKFPRISLISRQNVLVC